MNSLYGVPVTGLQGANFELNVVANNIANLNTSGYQAVEPVVSNLPAEAEIGDQNNGVPVPATTHVGMGVQPSATVRSQAQAALTPTGNPLDVAISGPGFFTLRQQTGQVVYAQQVKLQLQPDGQVVTDQGLSLVPPVRVPGNVVGIAVDGRGNVLGETRTGTRTRVGGLQVVTFAAPENLTERSGLYSETLGSGRPRTPAANAAQPTQIMPGYQLHSTVDLATEMANLIEAQRTYEANTKSLQTMDALVNTIVSLQQR